MKEALLLFLTITQYIDGVSLVHEAVEGVAEQVEIFMVKRLQRCIESDGRIGHVHHFMIKPHLLKGLYPLPEFIRGEEFGFHEPGVFWIDMQPVFVKRLYPAIGPTGILYPDDGRRGQQVE